MTLGENMCGSVYCVVYFKKTYEKNNVLPLFSWTNISQPGQYCDRINVHH